MVRSGRNAKRKLLIRGLGKLGRRKKSRFPLRRDTNPNIYCGEGISVIIPIGGKGRSHHLTKILQNIHAQQYGPFEVIISEYGDQQYYYRKSTDQTKYIWTEGGAIFNKSKAMNIAFSRAENNICVLIDADIILPFGYFKEVNKHMQGHEACFLLKRVLHTMVVKDLKHDFPAPVSYIRSDNFNGASVAIRKDAFCRIGGMCEDFVGYGYEDLEFWSRLRKLVNLNEDRFLDCLHLHHGHQHGYDKQWAQNQKLWLKLSEEVPQDRAKRFKKQLCERYKSFSGNVQPLEKSPVQAS